MYITILLLVVIVLLTAVIVLQFLFRANSSAVADALRDETARNREELNGSMRDNRQELMNSFKLLGDIQQRQLGQFGERMDHFSERNDRKLQGFQESLGGQLEKIREAMDSGLKNIQADNGKKLDEMRQVVDEKLRESVEKRFNESFKLISERLDLVHKGLGEMQTLANGVGDLKKVLTNVKTRGNLGEIQLANILEQCLSPDQYDTNVAVRPNTSERVEFCVKMPGRSSDDRPLYLPIDSKFPVEDYQRLMDAYEQPGGELESAQRAFESAVRKCARDIHQKYIYPPYTTDFAIMFVPTEGLYAEILRRGTLFESLNRDYKIAVVGPANLMAFLNSLQMGFRTLAIEKRSSEVWNVLGAVKTEFGKFGDVLEKTRRRLELAANEISNAGVRTRAIQRKLRDVQELPAAEATELLGDSLETPGPDVEPEDVE
jgi:DNA recombination protein RmuC